MTVISRPTPIARIGLSLNLCMRSMKASDSARGSTAEVIFKSPENSTPNPMAISPGVLLFGVFMNIKSMIPTTVASGANVSGLKNSSIILPEESISISLMICAVIVVPMLAPITMLTACLRFRIPALIRPTVRTIVAVELWITAVTSIPVITPITTFWVALPRTLLRAEPDRFFSPSPITSIP